MRASASWLTESERDWGTYMVGRSWQYVAIYRPRISWGNWVRPFSTHPRGQLRLDGTGSLSSVPQPNGLGRIQQSSRKHGGVPIVPHPNRSKRRE